VSLVRITAVIERLEPARTGAGKRFRSLLFVLPPSAYSTNAGTPSPSVSFVGELELKVEEKVGFATLINRDTSGAAR